MVKGQKNPAESYESIHLAKYGLLEKGYLRYQDVFPLALLYLSNNKNIPLLFRNRFAFVFLDEMQDSDETQVEILEKTFPQDPEIIIQRIGDPNQAIYHSRVHSKEYWEPKDPLFFSDSRRYGMTIANLLTAVRLEEKITLRGFDPISSLPPHLLAYKSGEEQLVIPAFSYLIKEFRPLLPAGGIYKAIGWIGKDKVDGSLCIPIYFPSFDKSFRGQSKGFPNLISYVACAVQIAKSEGASHFWEVILQAIVHVLDIADVKDAISGRNYLVASVDSFLQRENEEFYYSFREKMSKYFLLALNSDAPLIEIRDQIKFAIKQVWSLNNKTVDFLNNNEIDPALKKRDAAKVKNQFISEDGILVYIGTVHSVKGETHTATLYLETDYYGDSDSERLVNFLKGKRIPKELELVRHRENLKVAHVAFSRPTHLLAFACQVDKIEKHRDGLEKNGWKIRTVSELIGDKGGPR